MDIHQKEYLGKCLQSLAKGEVTATQYRRGAIVEGWPPRWPHCYGPRRKRSVIKNQSKRSLIRASWQIANSEANFNVFSTLTFRETHANPKACLRDFISAVLGLNGLRDNYAWVQEYQGRGVVHYHLLWVWEEGRLARMGEDPHWTKIVRKHRETEVVTGYCNHDLGQGWIDIVGDRSLEFRRFQLGGVHERVANPEKAGMYLGSYAGKEAQKELPDGEAPQGRWWYLSTPARPVPRGTSVVKTWPYKKAHRLVYDGSRLDPNSSAAQAGEDAK